MMLLSCSKKTTSIIKRDCIKNNGDFYCLHSFKTKNKLKSLERVCENKDFCSVVMPSEDTKILELNQYQNLIKGHLLFMQILSV